MLTGGAAAGAARARRMREHIRPEDEHPSVATATEADGQGGSRDGVGAGGAAGGRALRRLAASLDGARRRGLSLAERRRDSMQLLVAAARALLSACAALTARVFLQARVTAESHIVAALVALNCQPSICSWDSPACRLLTVLRDGGTRVDRT